MTTYCEYQVQTAPSWLAGETGEALNVSFGSFKDLFVELIKASVRARHPLLCSPDALNDVARDRDIDIGYNENQGQMSARLAAAWDTWTQAGRPVSIVDALGLAGYFNVRVIESGDDASLRWWEFDVVIIYPFPWTDGFLNDGLWDDPGLYDDGGVWPFDVPPFEVELVRSIVRKWKPTHSRCRRIVFVHSGDFWDDPIDLWSDPGDWHEHVTYYSP